jgi:AhpC/TSA antioxidant enzyme
LHRAHNELKLLNTEVLLISFGGEEQMRRWRDETGVDLLLLLDPEHQVYREYGLLSSLLRSWQPKVWWRYARMLSKSWSWRGIQGDSSQLGGDFIVDGQGILRYGQRSNDPTDRPSIAALLKTLRR